MRALFAFRVAKCTVEESVDRTLPLDALRRHYGNEYGGVQYAKKRLTCSRFERHSVTTKTVENVPDLERSTAYRTIDRLENRDRTSVVDGSSVRRERGRLGKLYARPSATPRQ